jgi:hypothetical protein
MSDCRPQYLTSDNNGWFIWLLLLSGALIHIPITLPGVSTQVSAFDIILPTVAIWTIWKHGYQRPSRTTIIIFCSILLALIGHSVAILLLKSDIQRAWLAKETLKSVVLTVEFLLLMILFRSRGMTVPPIRVNAAVLGIAIIAIGIISYQMLEHEPFFFARTVYCVALTGLLFFLTADAKWLCSTQRRVWSLVAAILVAGVAMLALSKAIAGLALAMTVWISVGPTVCGASSSRMAFGLVGLICLAIFGVVIAKYAGNHIDLLHRMDSIERSISVRLDLWSLALEASWQNFPSGFGLGQFWEVVVTDVTLAAEGHRYVHSTFVSLITELGALGFILSIGLLALVLTAARGWPLMVRPLFLLLVLFPLTIHDGHSIRMLLIVIALGLVQFLSRKEELDSQPQPNS